MATPARFDNPLDELNDPTLLKVDGLVNGKWLKGKARFAVTDPATGHTLAEVADLGPRETKAAIDAANAAWPAWRNLTAKQRHVLMLKWYQLLMEAQDDLARLMTAEQGKPLAEAKCEVAYGASFVEWFAEEAKRANGETLTSFDNNKRILVTRQPVGVCAAITPWNFPLAMITRKVAPALAAGCPVIIKPAEATPLTALAAAELAQRAGMPAGVLNVLTADSAQSIEIGHVLSLHRNRGETLYREDNVGRPQQFKLPEQRYGLVFVFRVVLRPQHKRFAIFYPIQLMAVFRLRNVSLTVLSIWILMMRTVSLTV